LFGRCSTALLVVIAMAGLALNFLGNVAVPHAPWWLRLPCIFVGLWLLIFGCAEIGRRIKANRRSR
jgi:hypothetical protein